MIRRTTIPLDRDVTGRFLPLIIAIMVMLATLMLMAAVLMGQSLRQWHTGLEASATVQILPLDDRALPLSQRVDMALGLLRASKGVMSAEPVSSQHMQQLLSPWLGEGALPTELPIPALIDVRLEPLADTQAVQTDIRQVAGASFDDHASWLRDIRHLVSISVAAAAVVVLLIIGASGLILYLLVRAGLNTHRDVVELLHLVGATDEFIAAQFQRHMVWVAGKGVILGLVLVIALVALLELMARRAGYAGGVPWLALPVIPLLFLLLAGYTSHRTARTMLAELP